MSNGGGDLNSADHILGGTDDTIIGNVGDRLKVDAVVNLALDESSVAVIKQGEVTPTSKDTETDLSGVTYTVPVDKSFKLTSLQGNYTGQTPAIVRLKKQTGGTGAFALLFKLVLTRNGQDDCNPSYQWPLGLNCGEPGDVFKITWEAAVAKGTIWASFTGLEY